MDGINPTLAFAALFLGLAGHPRDAAQSPPEYRWDQQGPNLFHCPEFVVALEERGNNDAATAPRDFRSGPGPRVEFTTLDDPSVAEVDLNTKLLDDQTDCGAVLPSP